MTIERLRELVAISRKDPHYCLRDATEEQFQSKADKSFGKLPEPQQLKALKSWQTALEGAGESLNTETTKELMRNRFLAQTNLFFLCKLLEKYSQVTVNTHEEICNEFFVQKDPTFGSFEEFANQYTDLKERLLLVPRGGFKSSCDLADCVQWVICYPAVTILILTGVYKLAGDFVGELKQHFTWEESGVEDIKTGKSGFAPRKLKSHGDTKWTSSMFQIMFPEHCIKPGEGKESEFQTPAEGDDKEPTVRAASIEQALSGMHFGVMKLDDVVTNENCRTPERLKEVNKQIGINRAMLHPFGFLDLIGTWYDEFDFYGITIKQEETFAKEMGLLESISGSVESGRFNSGVYIKTYLRAAWWPTKEAKLAGKVEAEMTKTDWEYWFPERLPYEFLIKEKNRDFDGFVIKYLNDPRKMNHVKFPRELLIRRTIPYTQLPLSSQGICVTTVDTAYSTKSWADYTVILTCIIFGGRFYVVNMLRGRYNEFELPAIIASVGKKWSPKRIAIEDSVGVKWMGRELRREMDRMGISIPVEFVSLGLGSKARNKMIKAKPVLRLLGDERMYFSNSCEGLQEIYNELEKFTGTSEDKHDDIVSAISLMAEQFSAYADMGLRMDFVNTSYVSDRQGKERHDMIYGLNRYSKLNANDLGDNPRTMFQVENDSRFRTDLDGSSIDPLADLI